MSSSSESFNFELVHSAADELSLRLDPLLEGSETFESLEEKLPITERVNLNLSLAYSLASVFYSALACSGTAPSSHPIMDDLGKIKGRIDRFRQLKGSQKQDEAKRELTVNQAAAVRIISHELALPSTDNSATKRKQPSDNNNKQVGTESKKKKR